MHNNMVLWALLALGTKLISILYKVIDKFYDEKNGIKYLENHCPWFVSLKKMLKKRM